MSDLQIIREGNADFVLLQILGIHPNRINEKGGGKKKVINTVKSLGEKFYHDTYIGLIDRDKDTHSRLCHAQIRIQYNFIQERPQSIGFIYSVVRNKNPMNFCIGLIKLLFREIQIFVFEYFENLNQVEIYF
jgi:hypothetical protein